MNEEGKVVAELSNEKWLWYLSLPCDFNQHLSYLNIKFWSQQKLISHVFGIVRAFQSEAETISET
jgi:hypothetical protein